MVEKRLLAVSDKRRPQIFTAKISRERTVGIMLTKIRKTLLGGSYKKLVQYAIADTPDGKNAFAEIRAILEKAG